MDDKMYQDEFEQFLQDEVKQHRMYPSDHIWKNIRTELHGYKAWPALTFISLFIITALTISTLLNNHPDRHVLLPTASVTNQQALAQSENATVPATQQPVVTNYFETIAPDQVRAATFANLVETVAEETLVLRNNSNDFAAVTVKTASNNDQSAYADKQRNKTIPESPAFTIQNTIVANPFAEKNTVSEFTAAETTGTTTVDQKKTDMHSSADDYLKDFGFVTVTPASRRNSKFGFQFYVTPSNSYRILSDEKVKEIIQPAVAATIANATQNVPLSANLSADVNNIVRHKPAMGFEIGFALLYNISNKFKLKTGVQLNVRQYYIETFQSLTNDLTSLALINYRGIETVSFYSPYNNNTGYRKTQLDNKVYQLSIPIGIQWDAVQGKHFGINAEGSVQPTFTLNTNTYLLSTDYKHYTGGNEYMRKWNVNTSMGINLTYRTGASSWQIGPQIRYQHLPTYTNLYPIKEHLVDYGIRLGYTHQIK
jgi:hypothetical protein